MCVCVVVSGPVTCALPVLTPMLSLHMHTGFKTRRKFGKSKTCTHQPSTNLNGKNGAKSLAASAAAATLAAATSAPANAPVRFLVQCSVYLVY
jgi:hypothetical protein